MTQAKRSARKTAATPAAAAPTPAHTQGLAPSQTTGEPSPVQPIGTPRLTKAAQLQAMLASPDGATLAHLSEALGWQSHTVRAALTRLRQAGHAVVRDRTEDGQTVYRISTAAENRVDPVADPGPENGPAEQGRSAAPLDPADAASTLPDGGRRVSALPPLDTMDRAALLALWVATLGGEAPPRLSQPFLRRLLAWELQARDQGGLSATVKRKLETLATGPAKAPSPKMKTGGRFLREWNGVTHVVDVVEGGFLWRGERHRSLSAIARAITGAHWSGPRFFGLQESGSVPAAKKQAARTRGAKAEVKTSARTSRRAA